MRWLFVLGTDNANNCEMLHCGLKCIHFLHCFFFFLSWESVRTDSDYWMICWALSANRHWNIWKLLGLEMGLTGVGWVEKWTSKFLKSKCLENSFWELKPGACSTNNSFWGDHLNAGNYGGGGMCVKGWRSLCLTQKMDTIWSIRNLFGVFGPWINFSWTLILSLFVYGLNLAFRLNSAANQKRLPLAASTSCILETSSLWHSHKSF